MMHGGDAPLQMVGQARSVSRTRDRPGMKPMGRGPLCLGFRNAGVSAMVGPSMPGGPRRLSGGGVK